MVAGAALAPTSWRTSASQPAVWGAAAEVPKRAQSGGLTAGQLPEPKPPPRLSGVPSAPRKSRPWNRCGAGPATPPAGHGDAPGHTVVSTRFTGPALLKPSRLPEPAFTAPMAHARPV